MSNFKTRIQAVVVANQDIFKLIKNTSPDIVVECIVCEDNINNLLTTNSNLQHCSPNMWLLLSIHIHSFRILKGINPSYNVN